MVRFAALTCLFLLCASALPAQDGGTLVLTGATLLDGRGGPARPDVTLVLEDGLLSAVLAGGDARSAAAREDARVIDLRGAFVVPGLIDAHVHMATTPDRARAEDRLRRLLHGGITSVRDMAGDARLLSDLARASRMDEIESPDLYYAALMAGPTFLSDPRPQSSARGTEPGEAPWMQAVTPGTDMVRAVARAKGTWATGIKIYADLEAAEVRRITAEAHAQGMRTWAHSAVFPARPQDVVGAGVDVVSHACRLAFAAADWVPRTYATETAPDYDAFDVDDPVFEDLLDDMARRGTILDATLALYVRQAEQRAANGSGRALPCDVTFARRIVQRAHERGVSIAAGTDFDTPLDSLPALFVELETLVRNGGLSPAEALRSATVVGARVLGIEETHGTLEPGKVANLVVVEADPTEDIANLGRIRMVIKNGRIVRGER